MNMEDFHEIATNELASDLVEAIRCKIRNSEGKFQRHDWSDPYRRWGWNKWKLTRNLYRMCLRCGYEARRVRL